MALFSELTQFYDKPLENILKKTFVECTGHVNKLQSNYYCENDTEPAHPVSFQ